MGAYLKVHLLAFRFVFISDMYRLMDGQYYYTGRVEVKHDGEWGTVCNDDFSPTDAEVVCRSLGYRFVSYNILFEPGHSIWCDHHENMPI